MKLSTWKAREPLASWTAEFDPWFDHFFKGHTAMLPEMFRRPQLPVANLSESSTEFTASFEVPGLEEKDLDVQVLGRQLVVSGERKWEEEKKDKQYYAVETSYGAFQRSVPLPEGLNLDPDAVKAKLSKGMLEVVIPKLEPRSVSKVKVDVAK